MNICADTEYVGHIVPLPNHYMFGMPQGAWPGQPGLFIFRVRAIINHGIY
jgi:hypothetical protein